MKAEDTDGGHASSSASSERRGDVIQPGREEVTGAACEGGSASMTGIRNTHFMPQVGNPEERAADRCVSAWRASPVRMTISPAGFMKCERTTTTDT